MSSTSLPLGQLVTFMIDGTAHLDTLRHAIDLEGLHATKLKVRLRPVDAFKRASNEIATQFPREPHVRSSLRVLPVGQDSLEVHRLIQRERRIWKPGQRRRADNETLFRIIFDRSDNTITVERQIVDGLNLSDAERAWIDQAIGDNGDALRQRYEHHVAYLDSNGLRTYVRDYLYALDAVAVKGSGGLYFVTEAHSTQVRALAKIITSVGSTMYVIPLVDEPEQRSMLLDVTRSALTNEVASASTVTTRILQAPDRRISADTFVAYQDRVNHLRDKTVTYSAMLGATFDGVVGDLHALNGQISELGSHVRHPKKLSRGE